MGKVLVVDDESGILSLLQRALRGEGHEVLCADTGETCLPVVRDETPDLIILDERLPGIDGIEVLRRIRDLDRGVYVVMMSAYGTIRSVVKAMELGAYDYLTKPFDLQDAIEMVSKALAMRDWDRSREDGKW